MSFKLLKATIALVIFFSTNLYATHYAGGEIMFECYPAGGPNAYRIVLALYFDCTGIPHPTS
ncbi:MAG: hypothetical protein NZ519_13720, partial [Bacteroidia bacterium]|nr:hypothetical protein [Bacteroidia bacterium]